jgi:hypothetical protein
MERCHIPKTKFFKVVASLFLLSTFWQELYGEDLEIEPWYQSWEVTGYAELETRGFFREGVYADQKEDASVSLAIEPEFYRAAGSWEMEYLVQPFLRLDSMDAERTHWDLREFWLRKTWSDVDVTFGVGKVFWGVAESQHLVDTINQTDWIENIDGEEKLGQPMVHTSWYAGEMGVLDFFFLLYFRERTFPGDKGRLRFDPVVLIDDASYESSMEQWHPDFAVRWSKVLSEFDIGLHFFSGTSRDPIFEFVTLSSGESALRPVYNLMSQVGVDAQWTHEGWLLKLEGLARDGRGQHFQAAVGGFEYTFYGLWESSIDMGLLGEYHFDNRWDSALTPFNHDVFAGTRWTWNDTHDSAVLAGTFWDHVNHSTTLRLEFERRLGERFTVSLETQWMVSADPNDFAYFFRRDGFVELELRTWF